MTLFSAVCEAFFFLGLASAPPDAVAILGCPCSYNERVQFFGKAWTLLDMKVSLFLLFLPSPLPDAVGLLGPPELLRWLCPDPWSGVSDIGVPTGRRSLLSLSCAQTLAAWNCGPRERCQDFSQALGGSSRKPQPEVDANIQRLVSVPRYVDP